jgi:hypothetical protein
LYTDEPTIVPSSLKPKSIIHENFHGIPSSSGKKVFQPKVATMEAKCIAPPPRVAKISIDASVKTRKAGVVAYVYRSSTYDFLATFSVVPQEIVDPAAVKAMACREALFLAPYLHLVKVNVALECLEVINSMEGKYMGKLSNVTSEINLDEVISRLLPSCTKGGRQTRKHTTS